MLDHFPKYKSRRWASTVILLLLIFLPFNLEAQTVSVSLSSDTVSVGEPVFISVDLSDVDNFGYLEFDLEYDDTILEYQSAEVNPIIAGCASSSYKVVPNGSNSVNFRIDWNDCDRLDINGTEAVINIDLGTLSAGTSTIAFQNYELRDASTTPISAVWNDAEVTVESVYVADNIPPVVAIDGGGSFELEVFDEFFAPGATATDDVDGDVTDSITIDQSSLNRDILDDYPVYYYAEDSSGNIGSSTLTVSVVDRTPPVLELLGDDPLELEINTVFVDPGASSTDNYDGDLSGSVEIVSSDLDTAKVGEYSLVYEVSDSSGNSNTVSRTIQVVDTGAPTIYINGGESIDWEVKTEYKDPGASAEDAGDGDISGFIIVDDSDVDTEALGTYQVTYQVSDSAGNTAYATRTVEIVDTTAPDVILPPPYNEPFYIYYVEIHDTFTHTSISDNVEYTDNYWPTLQTSVGLWGNVLSGDIDTGKLGTTTITYEATDGSGNFASTSATVVVRDTAAPVITFSSERIIIEIAANLELIKDEVAMRVASIMDAGEGAIDEERLEIDDSELLYDTSGDYQISVSVSDWVGNTAVYDIDVHVYDNIPPVINLEGYNPTYVEVGTEYVEPGFEANDNMDGDITDDVSIMSVDIDTSKIGTTSIEYSVSDKDGNSITVIREIRIVDTTAPMISLNEPEKDPYYVEYKMGYTEPGFTATDNYFNTEELTTETTYSQKLYTDVLGTTTATYTATDPEGNTASASRLIAVRDTTPPKIKLLGENEVIMYIGEQYTDAGATSSDNYDGNITPFISTSTDLDITWPGTYYIRYNVEDSSGNAAEEVRRKVVVRDKEAPVITLVGGVDDPIYGENTQYIEVFDPYVELGAAAYDDSDGVLMATTVKPLEVNVAVIGAYEVVYLAEDSSHNVSTTSRTVIVRDTVDPIITLTEYIRIAFGSSTSDDASAWDEYDGDISVVRDLRDFASTTLGISYVYYSATDSSANTTTATRTVEIYDGTPPVFDLGENPYAVELGSTLGYVWFSAIDDYDGDVSKLAIVDASDVDTSATGTYYMTYAVSDSSGNMAYATRTVDVIDTPPPEILNLEANSISKNSALIQWNTDIPATTQAEYGKTTSLGDISALNASKENNHSVSLSGLNSDTTYYYRVRSRNIAGEETISDIYSFTTSKIVHYSSSGGGGGGGGASSDTHPPRAPSNFRIATGTEGLILTWDNPVDLDLSKVVLLRMRSRPSSDAALENLKASGTQIYEGRAERVIDDDELSGIYYYVMYALDYYHNHSSYLIAYYVSENAALPGPAKEEATEKVAQDTVITTDKPVVKGVESPYMGSLRHLYGVSAEVADAVSLSEARKIFYQYSFPGMAKEEKDIYDKIARSTAGLNSAGRYRLAYFIKYGTDTTKRLGAGERGGVYNSYLSAFGKYPQTETQWQDVVKIANGRWPSAESTAAVDQAGGRFKRIYLRDADMGNPNDNAAVTIMAYGLRPVDRNMDSEKAAINSFKAIFGYDPVSAADWDTVRAIAYSGAKR